jgi:GGDEF domain-containing protein
LQATPDSNDETKRLEAVENFNLLSDVSGERFDRITRIAQRIFAMSMVDFSVISATEQLVKSGFGLGFDRIARETSLASYALLNNELLLVPDTLADIRFAGHPLVVDGPKIRFYAALPIHSKSGQVIGVFSLGDRTPRTLSPHDQSMFRDFAEMIENELSFIELAQVDRLTQMSINAGFYALAEQSLKICTRQRTPAIAVVFEVNRRLRASTKDPLDPADEQIKLFADQLRRFFRKSDVVGRLGRAAFTAVLFNARLEHVNGIVRKLQASIDSHNSATDLQHTIGFRHALAEFEPEQPVTSYELVCIANRALQDSAKIDELAARKG